MKKEEKKLITNTFLLMIGNFSSKLLVFLLVPLYTTVLTTQEYATSDLLTTTINLIYPFATLMVSTAVLRYCLDKTNSRKQLLTIGISVEIIGLALVTIGSTLFFNSGALKGYRIYFLAGFAGYSLYTLLMEYSKGCGKVSLYSFAGVCNTIVLISSNILFLLILDLGIKGYLLSIIISYWVTIILLFLGSKAWKDIVFPTKIERYYIKKMLKYSIPLMPNSISWWISNSSDRYMMNIFCGLNELGLYSVSYKIPSIMSTVSSIMISAWELSAVDDFGSEKSRKFFSKIYDLWVNTYIIICTVLIILVKLLAFILFQNEFYEAWRFVPVLLYASVFNGLSSFLGSIFVAAQQTQSIFITTLTGALVNILLNFLFIPFLGGYGAAIATAIAYFIIFIARLKESKNIMSLDIDNKQHLLKLSLLFLMVLLCTTNHWTYYIIGIIIIIIEKQFVFNLINKCLTQLKKN